MGALCEREHKEWLRAARLCERLNSLSEHMHIDLLSSHISAPAALWIKYYIKRLPRVCNKDLLITQGKPSGKDKIHKEAERRASR